MRSAGLYSLLVLWLAACGYDGSVPNARLQCVNDGDCPSGGRCLATAVANDAGGTTTLMLCCAGATCAAPTGSDAGADVDSPAPPDAPEPGADPDMDLVGEAGAPDQPLSPGPDGSGVDPDGGADGDSLSCTTNTCPAQPNTTSKCSDGQCQYICASGWGVCGAPINSSGCTTLLNTAANCGTCGRTCDCSAEGRCPPELIAEKVRGDHELLRGFGAYDRKDKFLYFIDLTVSGLQRIGLDGHTETVTEKPLFWPSLPTVAGDFLYWAEGTEMQSIRRMRLADVAQHGPIEVLVTGVLSPGNNMYRLAVIDQHLYWVVGSNLGSDLRVVQRRRIDGGPIETLLPAPEKIDRLSFAPGGIFWDNDCCGLRLRKAPLTGGAPTDFVAKPPETRDVRMRLLGTDAQYVYWNNAVPQGGTVWRLPQDAGPHAVPELLVAKLPREYPEDTGISFDTKGEPFLHWLYGDIGAVVRSSQSLYNVAFPATPFVGVVVEDTHVYWLDDKGTFGRAPK